MKKKQFSLENEVDMKSETDNSNSHSYDLNGAYHMPVLSITCLSTHLFSFQS